MFVSDNGYSSQYRATMFKSIRTQQHWRGLFAALLVCVLALRVAVPTGFMPTQTVQGIFVTICNGMGDDRTMVIDLQQSDETDKSGQEKAGHEPCVFASASVPMLTGGTPAFAMGPGLLLREFVLQPPVRFTVHRTNFVTPPLRGPPALV